MITYLDSEITIGELDRVVNESHIDSAPGYSGISYAQMKDLWPLIRQLFFRMTKQCLDQQMESLPLIMRMRRVILILKPTKRPDDENSYHPISLLEIPYKIIAAVFANRLKIATEEIIGPSQKGYMAGRCSADITQSVQDVRDYTQKNKPLAILGLDFSKAFDSISHAGLKKILMFLRFP
jgi:hypothetical protein